MSKSKEEKKPVVLDSFGWGVTSIFVFPVLCVIVYLILSDEKNSFSWDWRWLFGLFIVWIIIFILVADSNMPE